MSRKSKPNAAGDAKTQTVEEEAAASGKTAVGMERDAKAKAAPARSKPDTSNPKTVGGKVESKSDIVLKKLRAPRGTTIAQMAEITGWQAHSVRGFLSAVVRKKLGLNLMSETGKDGQRRYRIAEDAERAA